MIGNRSNNLWYISSALKGPYIVRCGWDVDSMPIILVEASPPSTKRFLPRSSAPIFRWYPVGQYVTGGMYTVNISSLSSPDRIPILRSLSPSKSRYCTVLCSRKTRPPPISRSWFLRKGLKLTLFQLGFLDNYRYAFPAHKINYLCYITWESVAFKLEYFRLSL